jgi:hypothetical protein
MCHTLYLTQQALPTYEQGCFRIRLCFFARCVVAVLEDRSPILYLANSTENSYGSVPPLGCFSFGQMIDDHVVQK